jgi:hypothetical protein
MTKDCPKIMLVGGFDDAPGIGYRDALRSYDSVSEAMRDVNAHPDWMCIKSKDTTVFGYVEIHLLERRALFVVCRGRNTEDGWTWKTLRDYTGYGK